MRADLEKLNSRLDAMTREELLLSIRGLIEECSEKDVRLDIAGSAATEMSRQFQLLRDKYAALEKEHKALLKEYRKATDKVRMRSNDLYGRKSEQASGIMDMILDETPEDPLAESVSETEAGNGPAGRKTSAYGNEAGGQNSRHGRKTAGKRAQDLSSMPTKTVYDLKVDELNQMYGEFNWRIAYWRQEDTIESAHTVQYHKRVYRPVISVGREHTLVSPYRCEKLMPGSLASPSLVAELMYQKAVQCVPSYRMEADFLRSGIPLSRQTITSWINRFCQELFAIVAEYMKKLLLQRKHNQCDETTYEVICDNRKAGSKSFVWIHTTSELDPGNPIIVYCFELTRGTDHLRTFYGDNDYTGVITSDAYCSYETLAKEYEGIHGSGCFMHARRRFHYAAMIIRVKDKTAEMFRELPEIKALSLIDAIYEAENPLKKLPSQERLQKRRDVVRQKVDAYFDYIKTLDKDDPDYSEKLRDAIGYSLNQESKLRMFLEDPMIPVDNGFCERAVKPFATSRRNCLFSYSIDGAESSAILFTLSETAKANHAHPYYYFKYLLETLPGQKVTKESSFLDDYMPWSETYRQYEKKEKEKALQFFADAVPPEKPKTPKKKDKCA